MDDTTGLDWPMDQGIDPKILHLNHMTTSMDKHSTRYHSPQEESLDRVPPIEQYLSSVGGSLPSNVSPVIHAVPDLEMHMDFGISMGLNERPIAQGAFPFNGAIGMANARPSFPEKGCNENTFHSLPSNNFAPIARLMPWTNRTSPVNDYQAFAGFQPMMAKKLLPNASNRHQQDSKSGSSFSTMNDFTPLPETPGTSQGLSPQRKSKAPASKARIPRLRARATRPLHKRSPSLKAFSIAKKIRIGTEDTNDTGSTIKPPTTNTLEDLELEDAIELLKKKFQRSPFCSLSQLKADDLLNQLERIAIDEKKYRPFQSDTTSSTQDSQSNSGLVDLEYTSEDTSVLSSTPRLVATIDDSASEEVNHTESRQCKAHICDDDCKSKPLFHSTYPGCLFATHSVADWRRHEETTKHWPQQAFMCVYCAVPPTATDPNSKCQFCHAPFTAIVEPPTAHYLRCLPAQIRGKTFRRKDKLLAHIRSDHLHITNPSQAAAAGEFQNSNPNWPRNCGFCEHPKYVFISWNERMEHIAQHFQDGAKIADWKLPLPASKECRPSGTSSHRLDDDDSDGDNDPHSGSGLSQRKFSGKKTSTAASSSSKCGQRSNGSRSNVPSSSGKRRRGNPPEELLDLAEQQMGNSLGAHRKTSPALERYLNEPEEPIPALQSQLDQLPSADLSKDPQTLMIAKLTMSGSEKQYMAELQDAITRARVVFQWADLVVNAIQYHKDGLSPREIIQMLKEVPEELDDVYKHALRKVTRKIYCRDSLRLMRFVCLAKRPLTVAEICFALSLPETEMLGPRSSLVELKLRSYDVMVRRIVSLSGGRIESKQRDMAYSSLDIFNICMSLIHGEGRANAVGRLQEAIDRKERGIKYKNFSIPFSLSAVSNIEPFVAREAELREIHKALGGDGSRHIVISTQVNWRDKERECTHALRTSAFHYEQFNDKNPERCKGKCQWFLQHKDFQKWKESSSSRFLWISGKPGAGKSDLLRSHVDKFFKDHNNAQKDIACAFFVDSNGDGYGQRPLSWGPQNWHEAIVKLLLEANADVEYSRSDYYRRTELVEAIKSMFCWCRTSTKCYVHLSDMSRTAVDTHDLGWEWAFRKSRWFIRGWTLQELVSLTSVEFFCRKSTRLSNKISLQQQIHEITGIAKSALQGAHLSQFSHKERFSWIQPSQTKIEEDKAYSLLGIFDVQIPLRYGEGMVNASKRLEEEIDKFNKCLQDLRLSDPSDGKTRIEKYKGSLLEDAYGWVLETSDFQQWRNNPRTRLLWIKGDPGTGKTMLLCSIINELKKSIGKSTLLSYFFCQATDSRINKATAVLRGLIYQLVDGQPSLISHVRKKYEQSGKALFEDPNAWVDLSEIFANILQDPKLNSTCLIVDALDECEVDLLKLLDVIVQTSSISSRIKWIVSSRNCLRIEMDLDRVTQKACICLGLNEKSVSAAVSTSIQSKVNSLEKPNKYDLDARDAVQRYLSSNANDTFLWVALVCQELAGISKWEAKEILSTFPPELDALYMRMMKQISISRTAKHCRSILATILTAYQPITLDELLSLIDMPRRSPGDYKALAEMIGLFGSFLTLSVMGIPSNGIVTIRKLENWLEAEKCPPLYAFVHGAKRFALHNTLVIEQTPLQLYRSALILTPTLSKVRVAFEKCIPSWIQTRPKVQEYWDALLPTLEGDSDLVSFVAFLPDGKLRVLSALDNWVEEDGVKILWLPPDYQATSTAFWNNSIAIEQSSGRLYILDFQEECLSTWE